MQERESLIILIHKPKALLDARES